MNYDLLLLLFSYITIKLNSIKALQKGLIYIDFCLEAKIFTIAKTGVNINLLKSIRIIIIIKLP